MLRLSLFSCEEFLLIILVRPLRGCKPPTKTRAIINAVHVVLGLSAEQSSLRWNLLSGLIKTLRIFNYWNWIENAWICIQLKLQSIHDKKVSSENFIRICFGKWAHRGGGARYARILWDAASVWCRYEPCNFPRPLDFKALSSIRSNKSKTRNVPGNTCLMPACPTQ